MVMSSGRVDNDIVMGSSRNSLSTANVSLDAAMASVSGNSWLGGGQPSSNGASAATRGGVRDKADGSTEITWSRGGRQFSSPREVYTRGLYRIYEDEGKPEPATAYWTLYGRNTTIGNGVPNSQRPDDICRRMDDSMSGPAAGILAFLTDDDGEQAAIYALRAGMTCGWHIRGERGDAAVRVGKAKVLGKTGDKATAADASKEARLLTLDAERWVLCDGASFAAGNSVFSVEKVDEQKQKLTIHCSKGPLRNKAIEVAANRCPFVFGRAHEADLCIMDRELSRKHGAILYIKTPGRKTGAFVLADLESTNGSYMRLTGPYAHKGVGALTIGDEFIVGRTGFSVNRFDCGISEAIGARPTMEDRTIVIQNLMYPPPDYYYNGDPKDHLTELAFTTFAAVFDGHGGDECSNYLVDALPRHIRNQMLTDREALKSSIENGRGPRGLHTESGEDATSEIMRRILKTAYLRADKEFITPKTAPQSGSTAATVLLLGRRLFAANVGDSRVVLARKNGACLELTSDHKPSRPDEAARVRAAGGFILHKRVMGELAITRAFGDKSFKMGIKAMLEEDADELGGAGGMSDDATKDLTAPLVSAEPEIASIVLSHDDEFLLLACDGLFDVFKSQDAITFARQELIAHRGEPAEVARILSDQAIRVRRSRDNVSILIIVLRPFWEDTPDS
ncbi:hypothetical protein ACHAXS_009795 [Conticribra weissflogii]